MSFRPSCCCPICELERALFLELSRHPNDEYRALTSQSSILSAFPTCTELLSHLRESYAADTHVSESDTILGELLRVSCNPQSAIARNLLLLILMPAIHRTSSQISGAFPSLMRDDIAQQLVTAVLDIVSSASIRAHTSHFAFTITRAMRRSAFRWAIREADLARAASGEEAILQDLLVDGNENFESNIFLSEFLTRCLSSGLLSPSEHELLVLFKLQGVSSPVLAARQKVSDVAFRHRMQRVIEKLRRAARAPWVFLKNPSVRSYIIEALKTWRKHNAALVLSTQSLDELRKSDILDVILESCVTKIFLANPDMDRELYQRQFHLNDHEIELVSGLVPKQQMLIKTPDTAKVANLNVDAKSYWLYTNDPFDNRKRDEAFAAYGFEQGLEILADPGAASKDIHHFSGD